MKLTLRPVIADPAHPLFLSEARFVLAVRNDAETRQMSRATGEIAWDEHLAWYRAATQDPKQHLFIIESRPDDVGSLRLVHDPSHAGTAEIHVALLPAFRGLGGGTRAIEEACEEARRLGYRLLTARIKEANVRSRRAFEKAGFVCSRTEDADGCIVMSLDLAARPRPS